MAFDFFSNLKIFENLKINSKHILKFRIYFWAFSDARQIIIIDFRFVFFLWFLWNVRSFPNRVFFQLCLDVSETLLLLLRFFKLQDIAISCATYIFFCLIFISFDESLYEPLRHWPGRQFTGGSKWLGWQFTGDPKSIFGRLLTIRFFRKSNCAM